MVCKVAPKDITPTHRTVNDAHEQNHGVADYETALDSAVFGSDETKLKSDLIGCVEYNERHTSENLKAFLCDVMAEWNIADYTTAIASDNAANITAAIRDTGRWHIPCFAHSITLCASRSDDSIGNVGQG
ncbi:unnamed protein product [Parnassius apollo]|uniref:(apollo) hypothetical protein n=1 Tax=Parnassius apollo TaxID=110799 RepID=A0A8S3XMF3_PARAO|nr:unnamed protein product [Parnassius apollo]